MATFSGRRQIRCCPRRKYTETTPERCAASHSYSGETVTVKDMMGSPCACVSVWAACALFSTGAVCSYCAFLESVFVYLAPIRHKAHYTNDSSFSFALCRLGPADPGQTIPPRPANSWRRKARSESVPLLHTTLPNLTLTRKPVCRAPNQPAPGSRQLRPPLQPKAWRMSPAGQS